MYMCGKKREGVCVWRCVCVCVCVCVRCVGVCERERVILCDSWRISLVTRSQRHQSLSSSLSHKHAQPGPHRKSSSMCLLVQPQIWQTYYKTPPLSNASLT